MNGIKNPLLIKEHVDIYDGESDVQFRTRS
jgi:hypothetical protein